MPRFLRAAILLGSVAFAQAAGHVETLPVVVWQVSSPSADFADLPTLRPEVDYTPDNDLRSLAFVCEGERFYALIVSPGFDYGDVTKARLSIGNGGPDIGLRLRALNGASGPVAPKLDWDADVLYAPIEMEDLSEMAPVEVLTVKLGEQEWRLPLPGLQKAVPAFLEYCATGEVSYRSVLAE